MTICAKSQALFNVLGHSFARFPDGRTVQVTPNGLKNIRPQNDRI